MIRIAIVEDEKEYVDILKDYIQKCCEHTHTEFRIWTFSDGYDIADNYKADYDIIFMDIEMNLMNGMEAAENIREMDTQVVIVFITNMAQYAIEGYRVNALDYVLKPISYFTFSETFAKAVKSVNRNLDQYLTITTKYRIEKIKLSELCWIESHGHRLTFYTQSEEFETTVLSMNELEVQLAENGFARCNTGYILNLNKVSSMRNNCAIIGNNSFPISRGRRDTFMKALTEYITG